MADESFIYLVNGYLEGKLDKDDLKRFLALLDESAENREIFARNTVISRLIEISKRSPVSTEQIMMALPRHGDTAKLIIDQLRSSGEIIGLDKSFKKAPARKNVVNGRRKTQNESRKPSVNLHEETPVVVYFFRAVSAMAACALVAFGLWRYVYQANESLGPSIATLDCRGDVLIKRGELPIPGKIGTPVYNGDALLIGLQAVARIRYNRENTTVRVQEGSLLWLDNKNDSKGIYLKQGTVIAHVAPQPDGKPMILTTPKAIATVIGTHFTLKSMEASTSLDVTQGKVRITRGSDNTSADVTAGKRIEVNDNSPLSLRAAQPTVLGHLGDKQIEEIFETMTTARAFGINTLTFNVSSLDRAKLPGDLRTAIATAHRANIQFYAKIDIPKDIGNSHDSFAGNIREKLAQLVVDYNFDGIYVAHPQGMMNENYLKQIGRDVFLAANTAGVPVETGVQREVSGNDTWFIGY